MNTLFCLCLAVGLSAACGFRVFVPLLVLSIAARVGQVELTEGFDWLGTDAAILAFGVATLLEIIAYYVPWFDNLLDNVAVPASVIAGTLISASVIVDIDPLIRWSLALIAGGGSAGLFQGSTTAARLTSTATTGGLGNPIVSTAEASISGGLSLLAVLWPVVAACLVAISMFWVAHMIRRLWSRWKGLETDGRSAGDSQPIDRHANDPES